MENTNLIRIVNNLVIQYGYQGAYEYISTGEYPHETKELALGIVRQKESQFNNMVISSEFNDIENPWSIPFETLYSAS